MTVQRSSRPSFGFLSALVSVASLIALLLPRQASAQKDGPRKVAVVRIDFTGGASDAARDNLARRLIEGMRAVAFEVVGGAAVSNLVIDNEKASACKEQSCYPRVAAALGVDYLIAAQVSEKQKTYELNLELINGKTGLVAGSNKERCEICGVEEVGEKMSLASAALRTRIEALVQAPSRMVIRTRPEGARVFVDGRPVGRSPLDTNLAPGLHTLKATAEGFDAGERTVTTVAGVDENLEIELLRQPSKFPYKAAGIAAVVASVAAIAAGAVLLATNGKELECPPSEQDRDGHCPEIWQHGTAGAILLATGAVAGTLGGMWLFLGSQTASPESSVASSANPGINTFRIGYSRRF